MKLIAYSEDDLAGKTMAKLLKAEFKINERNDVQIRGFDDNFRNLSTFEGDRPELCVVASRHKAESGQPTLTCHPTGNFGVAELGGADQSLQLTSSLHLRKALLSLYRVREDYGLADFEVSLEVTHHGPTDLSFPLLYMEVGSSEEQWVNLTACRAVADAINHVVSERPVDIPSAIGFGGPHYAPNFSEVVRAGAVACGHIAPKHAMDDIDEAMVVQMLEKTVPRPSFALIDWKGLRGAEKSRITDILEGLGVAWRKTREFKR